MPEASTGSTTVMGAVLAGGESRRMGRDKALLEVEGRTLLAHAVAVLEAVFEEVVVVAPLGRGYGDLGVEVVPDTRPGRGPLGGMHAALDRGHGRPVFVLACDMPHVTPQLVRWIVGSGSLGPAQVRLPRDIKGLQPLCGLYSGECLPAIERALDEDRLSVLALVESLEARVLALDCDHGWHRSDLLANVNRSEAFEEMLNRPRRRS
jgi:molybdopterin-guanine dinucleotide biosynthesis protein A